MRREHTCVLLPYDGTPESLAALGPAVALAEISCDILHVIHVCDRPCSRQELLDQMDLPDGLPRTTFDIVSGDPAEMILKKAEELQAGFIVMAAKNLGNEASPPKSSVVQSVLRNAQADVLVVPPGVSRPRELRHIMVPLDGTPSAAQAMPVALRLAKRANARLSMLHIRSNHVDAAEVEPGSFFMIRLRNSPEEIAYLTQEFMERFVQTQDDYDAEIFVDLEIAAGRPAEEILQAALRLEVDLIVSSWHGDLKAGKAGVLKDLVSQAPCPVLVVKVGAHRPSSRLVVPV